MEGVSGGAVDIVQVCVCVGGGSLKQGRVVLVVAFIKYVLYMVNLATHSSQEYCMVKNSAKNLGRGLPPFFRQCLEENIFS